MEIKFKEQMSEGMERNISLRECEHQLAIATNETTKSGSQFIVYFMDREQLSEYIGALIHFQSKLKRGV